MRNIVPWLLRYLLCDYNVFLIWFSIFLSSFNMVIYLGLFFPCANSHTLAHRSVLKLIPVVVQSSSHVWLFVTPRTATRRASVPHHLPQFAQVHVYRFSDESKIWSCKEQYSIGTWNARSTNQSKLTVVMQKMVRINSSLFCLKLHTSPDEVLLVPGNFIPVNLTQNLAFSAFLLHLKPVL